MTVDGATQTNPATALLPAGREDVLLGLAGKLQHSFWAADENRGHLEEQLRRGGHKLFGQRLAKAAQRKAAAAPPRRPNTWSSGCPASKSPPPRSDAKPGNKASGRRHNARIWTSKCAGPKAAPNQTATSNSH